MALQTVGLKTHIWNNNLKAGLFLLVYPAIIWLIYASLVILVVLFTGKWQFPEEVYTSNLTLIAHVLKIMVLPYWFVPYLFVAGYLWFVFHQHKNRLDIPSGKEIVTQKNRPELYQMLENLCISRGIVTPYLFIRHNNNMNAYTSGLSDHTYYIVVTSRLLENLTEEELETVLAHELTHIINCDTRLMFLIGKMTDMLGELARTLSDILARSRGNRIAIMTSAFWVIVKLGNIGALFARAFISQKKEYLADAGAVELTKNPRALISALDKIGNSHITPTIEPFRRPLLIHNIGAHGLLSTHPSIEERIRILEEVNHLEHLPGIAERAAEEEKKRKALEAEMESLNQAPEEASVEENKEPEKPKHIYRSAPKEESW